MNTEPEFLSKQCPPCMGDCRQGRNCPARSEPAEDDFDENLGGADKAQIGAAIVFALCVLGGCVALLLRGCAT
jgi:hypothetical protein